MWYQKYFLFLSVLAIMSLILPFNVPIKGSLAQNFTSNIDASFLSEEDNKLYLFHIVAALFTLATLVVWLSKAERVA